MELEQIFSVAGTIAIIGWVALAALPRNPIANLFSGAWETRDAQRNGIPHLVVFPCLLMTFMLGPIGLLFYFAIRTAKTRSVMVSDTVAKTAN